MRPADVIVVGGGPVGLFQALSLQRAGFHPRVLERRTQPHAQSRSIGIHPPSLEALAELDLATEFLAAGVRVRRGRAIGAGGALLGTIGFDLCDGPYPFVLALPQRRTEQILRAALDARLPGALMRGVELKDLRTEHERVVLETTAGPLRAKWVVACDGRRSRVRHQLGVDFDHEVYEGEYAMEDHPDDTPFGSEAAIFLTPRGVVESFPLPGGLRRWVARTDGRALDAVVAAGTGFQLSNRGTPTSVFRAERGLASRLLLGRVVLGGDAAHVVSPIGGQGMNLGWLGACRTTHALQRANAGNVAALSRLAQVRTRMARAAARRAELNMWLGRPTPRAPLRDRMLETLLHRPWSDLLARGFTMRGLQWGL